MKKIIGCLLLLIALLLGTYYVMGYLTEKKIKQDLAVVNQSNGLAVDLRSYQRGFFTSKVNFDLHIRPPEKLLEPQDKSPLMTSKDIKIQLPVTIHHGPIIFSNKQIKFGLGYAYSDLPFPQEYNQQFDKLFKKESIKPHLIVSFFLNYLGHTKIDANVPSFKLFSKMGKMVVDWSGMSSMTHIASDLDHIKGNVDLKGLNMVLDKFRLKVSEGETHYHLYRTQKPELFLGDASLSLPSFLLTDGEESLIELDQFKFHSNSDVKNGLFSLNIDASADKMKLKEESYNQSKLGFSIRNLDAEIVAKIETQMRSFQQGADIQRQGAFLAILSELPALLNKAPEVEIRTLAFTTAEGQISGNLKLSLPVNGMINPLEFTQKIKGQGELKIPAVIVKTVLTEAMKEKLLSASKASTSNTIAQTNPESIQTALESAEIAQESVVMADKQIATLVQNGFLKETGAYYIIEASLNEGKILVNGKPFDIGSIKF